MSPKRKGAAVMILQDRLAEVLAKSALVRRMCAVSAELSDTETPT